MSIELCYKSTFMCNEVNFLSANGLDAENMLLAGMYCVYLLMFGMAKNCSAG